MGPGCANLLSVRTRGRARSPGDAPGHASRCAIRRENLAGTYVLSFSLLKKVPSHVLLSVTFPVSQTNVIQSQVRPQMSRLVYSSNSDQESR